MLIRGSLKDKKFTVSARESESGTRPRSKVIEIRDLSKIENIKMGRLQCLFSEKKINVRVGLSPEIFIDYHRMLKSFNDRFRPLSLV